MRRNPKEKRAKRKTKKEKKKTEIGERPNFFLKKYKNERSKPASHGY